MFKPILSFERQISIVVLLLMASICGCSQTSSTNTPTKTAATQEAAPANAKIALNRRELGTTADTTALRNTLSEIIKNRHSQSVVKPGSTEIERTVYVKAAPSIGMTEVAKIIEIAKEAGASPVSVPIEIDIDKAGDLKPNPLALLLTIGDPESGAKVIRNGIPLIVGPTVGRSERASIPKEFLIVTVSKDGEYQLDEKPVPKTALTNELRSRLKGRTDQRVCLVLDGASEIRYSSLSDVAYAGFEAGASEIYIITLH